MKISEPEGTGKQICFPARSDDPRSTDVIGRESGGVLTTKHLSSPFVNILKQLQLKKVLYITKNVCKLKSVKLISIYCT